MESIQNKVDRKGSEVDFNSLLGAASQFIGSIDKANLNNFSVVPTICSSDYHIGVKSINLR